MAHPITNKRVYTLEEASRLLRVQPVTIRRLLIRGKIRRVPFIRHIRIPVGDVDRLVSGGPPS
jgi:excisionase family DNA binding protein